MTALDEEIHLTDKFRGCLVGLACGDAVGTTLEFRPRGTFKPLCDMIGGGPFSLQAGEWTDDTSMALCLAESLIDKNGFDPRDQMDRYLRWFKQGHLSCTGSCFDIGLTVRKSLEHYTQTSEPFSGPSDPLTAGNGSIMRLAPIPIFFYPDVSAAENHATESSRTTHGAIECIDACRLLSSIICRAWDGVSKEAVLFGHAPGFCPAIDAIAGGTYSQKNEPTIKSDGYVVNSLEAALWCFLKTDSFKEAILLAANLGSDADTTAAICGQVAGAFYGMSAIPQAWLSRLAWLDRIIDFADRLRLASPARSTRANFIERSSI